MKIHEYQAKQILSRHGVPVPRGGVAETPEQAREIAAGLGGPVVLKAQIHAGGRGKAGGIRTAATAAEAEAVAREMIGRTLITPQTGPAGRMVRRLLVEEAVAAARELYLGFVVDRAREAVAVMASTEGGVEIETVAATRPDLILREWLHPAVGLAPFQAKKLAFGLGLSGGGRKQAEALIASLDRSFHATDASLVEINPLVVAADGRLLALDAKMSFDDSALARRPDVAALRDLDEETPLEVEAGRAHLNYIQLDGDIGCLVNGAGLAMATMDIIHHAGGAPANFLDVGGGVTEEAVASAFKILLAERRVRAALINIFGGIVRCDMIAAGVVKAARELSSTVPVVVRMEGTNVAEGRKILADSGLAFHSAADMREAAALAVALARGGGGR